MKPGEKQFWRVVNSAAVTILDLQLLYDGVPQPLQIVALDSIVLGSQSGSGQPKTITKTDLLIPPAGRAEFIVTGPPSTARVARLVTRRVDTGPGGDPDPLRPLFTISTSAAPNVVNRKMPEVSGPPPPQRFAGLFDAKPTKTRTLYFSEDDTNFYITVDGQTPKPYSMDDPPAIVTTQGSVEDWIIQNRANENHEFHMHQIHFALLQRNGKPVSVAERQMLDTVDIPYWTGSGDYPSITVRMDFRGPDVGDFVYHCHILDHEDGGMMAIIRVLPRNGSGSTSAKQRVDGGPQKKVAKAETK
jgi:FtsP/CotA-like multicopper oxidase with cupredoxin domain